MNETHFIKEDKPNKFGETVANKFTLTSEKDFAEQNLFVNGKNLMEQNKSHFYKIINITQVWNISIKVNYFMIPMVN